MSMVNCVMMLLIRNLMKFAELSVVNVSVVWMV